MQTTHKKGISSLQLSKDIEVTQKTAWFMLHRIRQAFQQDANEKFYGEVELDETVVGGKNKNRHSNNFELVKIKQFLFTVVSAKCTAKVQIICGYAKPLHL